MRGGPRALPQALLRRSRALSNPARALPHLSPASAPRLPPHSLEQPERAFQIVRESNSSEGAKTAARFCTERKDWARAIEFLILSKAEDAAFELATRQGEVDAFTAALGKSGSAKQYRALAEYYEQQGAHGRSGDFWLEVRRERCACCCSSSSGCCCGCCDC